MQTRKLGYTDLELPSIGLGTWAMGGAGWQYGWGPQDDTEAVYGILTALDEGINWIDTAAIYGFGHSEDLVGRALKQIKHKPLVATKCGLIGDPHGHIIHCLKADSIAAECEASLKRLGVDAIDLYQIHWPDPEDIIEQGWEQMAKLAEQGKVRYVGVSNFNVEQIARAQKVFPVASVQPPYSMIRRGAENELFGYCTENDIGIVAYSPMQRGLLTGKFTQERLASLSGDDHRRKASEFQEPEFSATLKLVDELRLIAERNDRTPAQLAISWVLRRREVTAAIVGARRPEQIKETVQAGGWRLTQEEIDEIEQLLSERLDKINTG